MTEFSLNGKWTMTGAGYEVYGNVPGSVYSFLHVDNDILPDPFYRNNEEIYLKIAEQEFSLRKGDKIIITGGDTSGTSGNTNLIKIEIF